MSLRSKICWCALALMGVGSLTELSLQAISLPSFGLGEHIVWGATDIYHVKRSREGGAKQRGWLYGVRGAIERVEPNALYWGIEGAWAKGPLEGHSQFGRKLKLYMSDAEVEARFGLNLSGRLCLGWSLTLFVGGGYYEGVNSFVPPSRKYQTIDTYSFSTVGIMTRLWDDESLSVGANVKVRHMYEAKERILDPEDREYILRIEDKDQWIVELPISTCVCILEWPMEAFLIPFYQKRHYGGREGEPDFVDTKFQIYGLRFALGTIF